MGNLWVDTGVNDMPRSSDQGLIDLYMQVWERLLEEQTFEFTLREDKNDHSWDGKRGVLKNNNNERLDGSVS